MSLTRRKLLLLGAMLALPAAAQGRRRIGFLAPVENQPVLQSFRSQMHDLGYVDGAGVLIDYRHAGGRFERLPQLAAALVDAGCEILVSHVTEASLAARRATDVVPIVMIGVGDPVGAGLIASFSRPGGNVTGTSSAAPLVAAKSLEIMSQALPRPAGVAVLWNPRNSTFQTQVVAEVEKTAQALGVRVELVPMSDASRFEAVFTSLSAKGVDGVLVLPDPLFNEHRAALIRLASNRRRPAMFPVAEAAAEGALMAYGPDYRQLARRAAVFVDKILKGAKPAQLAVEQATQFHLALNLRTAKALGISIPRPLLVRADEVIH